MFARTGLRGAVQWLFPPMLERSCYAWVASLMLVAVCWCWRPVPGVLYVLPAWAAWLGAAAQDEKTPPKPLYLRRPDARPQDGGRLPRR